MSDENKINVKVESHTKYYITYFLIIVLSLAFLLIVMKDNRELKQYNRELLINISVFDAVYDIQTSRWNDTLNQWIDLENQCEQTNKKYWYDNINLTQQLLSCRIENLR